MMTEQVPLLPLVLIQDLCRRGPGLEQYVTSAMVQLLCRMTNLCWFDDDRFKGIVDDSKRLLEKGSQVSLRAW